MKRLIGLVLMSSSLSLSAASDKRIHTLYNTLDPNSVAQHLALYSLYPESEDGAKALAHARNLLTTNSQQTDMKLWEQTADAANLLVSLVTDGSTQGCPLYNEQELRFFDQLGQNLAHRKLPGYLAQSEADVLKLAPEEVDIARGLLLSQLGSSPESMNQIRSYEALLDLMALQVQSHLPKTASGLQKVEALNWMIFEELGFRFPPQSEYAEDIDLYSFLPSVLDSRRGVCLGVSTLYLCLAQRLDLPLEIITPPGHIYVRYNDGKEIRNIETTARGIHLTSDRYLSVNTRSLQLRNPKEVIGMAHFNQAAAHWKQNDYPAVVDAYRKALSYCPDDALVEEYLGYALFLTGKKQEAFERLERVRGTVADHAVCSDPTPADILDGRVGEDGIAAIFMHTDEIRESVIEKQKALESALEKHPRFRMGWLQLATSWLQQHREGEALEALQKYHELDPKNVTVQYYMAILHGKRMDFRQAWNHLARAEQLAAKRGYEPKPLHSLHLSLSTASRRP